MQFTVIDHPHPASLSEGALMKQCTIGFGRDGGPGGQHRNKVDTAVRLVHEASGIEVRANQRRKQYENRKVATHRMREQLAIQLRCRVNQRGFEPSELWRQRRQGQKLSVNPRNSDYPALLAEALDVIYARNFDVAGAAGLLGITMSQLARLLRHHKKAFGIVNEERLGRGLPKLK